MAAHHVCREQGLPEGGAVALFIALLFLVGGAFAIGFLLVPLISFVAAGLLGLLAGATTPFEELTFWGTVAFVLAVLSFSLVSGRKGARERKAAHE